MTRFSSPSYEEGEGDSREVENGQSRQKSYIHIRRMSLQFKVDDWGYLKVSSTKDVMRFSKKVKLNLQYIGPYCIAKSIHNLAYELELPQKLGAVSGVSHLYVEEVHG